MQKIYYGGDIITMVNETDAPEAVLVEDGKIKFVGSYEEAERTLDASAEKIDLKGKTIMPSFIDGHSHISLYAMFAQFPDLSECTSFEEIVNFLKEYLVSHPVEEGGVLFATNYDHNFLKELKHPTRKVLDQISSEIPIWIYHVSSHMGVANTKLLEMAGLTDDTPDPQGGHYGRFSDGTLNGYAEEIPAIGPILMRVFAALNQDSMQQMLSVQDVYLKYGVTTVQDGSSSVQGVEGFLKMAENHLFKVDVVSYPMYNESPAELLQKYPQINQKYYNHFKVAGAKILLDGSPQAKSAWLSKPYEGEESYCGYGTLEDSVVEAAARDALTNGYQLLAHANGDAASEQFIRCYKKALEDVGEERASADLRPVMIHCQTVRDDQLDEMVKIGMLPSIFVAHTYFWGDVHLKNLGSVRGAHISPVKSALDRGMKYNFHQDCPVLAPDMMRTVWCAVNRLTRNGVSIGPEQRIGIYDALKGITINAAYEYHEENEKGTLESGKLADLVILDKNPLKTDPMELKDIQVLETIKEGTTLYMK